jgi:peptide subunit release factor 1 (eRF1)
MISQEDISRILRLHANDVPILSLYARVPAGPGGSRELQTRVDSLLSEIRPLGSDHSVDRAVRLSVRADIERVEKHLADGRTWRPGTLALFSCSAHEVFEEVALPRAVRDRVVLDATPWVRSLLAVLDEYRRMCVVFVERGRARVYEMYQDELRELGTRRERPLHARHVPALDEDRVRNKAEEHTKRHFREVAAMVDGLFRTDGFDLLALGSHPHETPRFADQLPRHLRDRIAGTFTLDTHPTELAHIRERATEVLRTYEDEQQRRRVAEVVEKAAAGGRATLGVAPCLWAGALTAIDTLLVEEGAELPGVVCNYCGWLGLEGPRCTRCGHEVRPVPDVLDELTPLREHLAAATLRFDLPPE